MNRLRVMPAINPNDRLGVMLFFALAVHALVILGVSFHVALNQMQDPLPTLDITLVQNAQKNQPDEADYLAAANQDGAANTTEHVRPSSALPGMQSLREAQFLPQPLEQPVPPALEAQPTDALTAAESSETLATDEAPSEERPNPTPQQVAQMIARAVHSEHISELLEPETRVYGKDIRHTFVSARTKEYKYAQYVHDWVKKVERVGNLNFPNEVARRNLSGRLTLDVAVRADGSIEAITVITPSRHKVLNQAAQDIVRLAAPFAPLPAEIRKETDVLHITRTWEFLSGSRVRSR